MQRKKRMLMVFLYDLDCEAPDVVERDRLRYGPPLAYGFEVIAGKEFFAVEWEVGNA